MAVNMIIFQIFTGTDFYIPFTYKSMKIFRDLPSYFYSKIERHDSGIGSEVIAFSVTLVDPEGRLLAKIDECTVKKVNKFNDYFSCNFYGTKWLETDSIESNQENVTGNVLIFADKDGIAEALTAKIQNSNNTIYKISFSDHYEKIDENNYSISGSIDDYDRLLDDLRITTISKVYHLASIDFKKNYYSYSDFEVEMNKGVYSLVYMNKIFTKRVKGLIDFVVVSDNTYKVIENEDCYKPANTSFFGLIKALKYECPSFTFKCVDIDRNSDKEFIINTIINSNNDSDTIAVRNNMHYTEVLDSFDTSNVLKKEVDVLEEDIYLITGGTGGLGLVMATNLSEFAHCNLCLLSRKEIPSRNLWDEIIANNEDVKLCNLIKNVRNIEERGCNVVFKKSDVSDKETMKVIINELRSEYGRINGVIHCAGVAGEGFNLTKPIDVFEKVINPKVYGSIVLGELLKDEALDFFIMFSSMTSILGGPGQGDYAAANAFLDGYANYLCMNGLQAQAINWPGWSETGMAVDYNIADAITLFKSLNNQFGVSIFNRIIRTDLTNIIPGNINLQFIQKIGLERLPIRLSKQLRKEFDRFQAKNETAVSNTMAMTINPADIVLKGKSEDEYTETERTIAYIYASVLNLPEIDVFDNFSSMGGDSIISTEVFKILNQQFNGVLSISDIFLYPTVESIAEYVDSLMNQDEKKEEIESFSNVIDKFEQGEVDIDSVINFLDEK